MRVLSHGCERSGCPSGWPVLIFIFNGCRIRLPLNTRSSSFSVLPSLWQSSSGSSGNWEEDRSGTAEAFTAALGASGRRHEYLKTLPHNDLKARSSAMLAFWASTRSPASAYRRGLIALQSVRSRAGDPFSFKAKKAPEIALDAFRFPEPTSAFPRGGAASVQSE